MKKIIALLCGVFALINAQTDAFVVPGAGQFAINGGYDFSEIRVPITAFIIQSTAPASLNPDRRFSNEFQGKSGAQVNIAWGVDAANKYYLAAGWRILEGNQVGFVESGLDTLIPVVCTPDVVAPPTTPFTGSGRSTLDYCFNDLWLVGNYHLGCVECFDLFFLLGLEYLNFNFQDKVLYTSATDAQLYEFRRKTDTWGLGFRVGIDMLYTLFSEFGWGGELGLHIKGTGAAIIGQNRPKFKYNEEGVTNFSFDTTSQRYTRVIPSTQARIGMNYIRFFGKCDFVFEFGYDVSYYANMINELTFTSHNTDDQGRLFDHYSALGTQGFFAELGVRY